MPALSPTANQLISILNNINELVVISNDRAAAKDVMRAFRTYAQTKNFSISDEKIDNFLSVLLDSRTITVSSLLQDIASDVSYTDRLKKVNKTV